MPSTWFAEPSAIDTIAFASETFLVATVNDLMFVRSLLATDRPAASSDARLMRKPLESFSMLLLIDFSVPSNCLCVLIAATLVLMRSAMIESSLIFFGLSDHPWSVLLVISFFDPDQVCLIHAPFHWIWISSSYGIDKIPYDFNLFLCIEPKSLEGRFLFRE
jgi:hypothetical protein